jgi:hypothetical protein
MDPRILFDEEDRALVERYDWLVSKAGYAFTGCDGGHLLHRLITGCPKGMVVDHIDGNGLDNRRSNLRVCTIAENVRHRVRQNRNNASGVRGVRWDASRQRWTATLGHEGHTLNLGRFLTKEEAIEARRAGEARLQGVFSGKL